MIVGLQSIAEGKKNNQTNKQIKRSSPIKTNCGSLAALPDICVSVRVVVGRSEHMKGDLGSCLMMAYVLGRMQLPSLKNPSYNTPQRPCGLQTGKGGSGHKGGTVL